LGRPSSIYRGKISTQKSSRKTKKVFGKRCERAFEDGVEFVRAGEEKEKGKEREENVRRLNLRSLSPMFGKRCKRDLDTDPS
jgi:hypothetical protein